MCESIYLPKHTIFMCDTIQNVTVSVENVFMHILEENLNWFICKALLKLHYHYYHFTDVLSFSTVTSGAPSKILIALTTIIITASLYISMYLHLFVNSFRLLLLHWTSKAVEQYTIIAGFIRLLLSFMRLAHVSNVINLSRKRTTC